AELDVGNLYVNRPTTGARVGVEPFGGHRLSGTGPKAGGREYLWAFITSRAGLRIGDSLARGGVRLPEGELRPWREFDAAERTAILRRALNLLRGDWAERLRNARARGELGLSDNTFLESGEHLLARMDEIAVPEPTVHLPGQETHTRWNTPRGVGLVLVDAGSPPADVLALLLGALLAG